MAINIIDIKKNRGFLQELIRNKTLYLMLLPGLVAVLIFYYGPMLFLSASFFNYDPVRGMFRSPFVGFDNFKMAINDVYFRDAFMNTIIIKFSEICCTFLISIILALFLNEVGKNNKRITQTATILPYFVSWIVVAAMFQDIFSPDKGLVNEILIQVFHFKAPIAFLSDPNYFRLIIIFQDTWKFAGYFALIYLAAMTAVDPVLYEVAEIDGAGRWRKMWSITLPSIKTTLITMFVLLTGYVVIGPFEQIFAQYSASVYSTGDIIETYVYRLGITQYRYGYATAAGLIQSIIATSVVVTVNYFIKKTQKESIF